MMASVAFTCAPSAACLGDKAGPGTRGRRPLQRLRVSAHGQAAEGATAKAADCPPVLPAVALGVVGQLDVRVGVVLSASAVDVSSEERRGDQVRTRRRKLLKLEVDIGSERRTIVSDIYHILDEESAPGQKIIVLANTEPREVSGVASHGHIL